jgi:hypothetical protein
MTWTCARCGFEACHPGKRQLGLLLEAAQGMLDGFPGRGGAGHSRAAVCKSSAGRITQSPSRQARSRRSRRQAMDASRPRVYNRAPNGGKTMSGGGEIL